MLSPTPSPYCEDAIADNKLKALEVIAWMNLAACVEPEFYDLNGVIGSANISVDCDGAVAIYEGHLLFF